jgi:putative FmdB family regulatory protein
MPIYEYHCDSCGKTSEELMPSGVEYIHCAIGDCGGLARRIMSSFSVSGMSDKSGNKEATKCPSKLYAYSLGTLSISSVLIPIPSRVDFSNN